jgi:hypothetical protein
MLTLNPRRESQNANGDDQAQRWLNDFKRYLQQTEPEQSVKTNNYLIYLLDQSVSLKKLTVDVQKARRNKNGSIAGKVIIPNMKISPESI